MRRHFPIVLAAGAALLAATPAARADDAQVKQVVVQQEAKLAPDNKAVANVIGHVTKSNAAKAKSRITKVMHDVTGYRTALLKVQASTNQVAKGRKHLLTALSEQRSGLRMFKTAISKYANGASDASVKRSVLAAVKKLRAGQKDAAKAAKLLGIT
jgi:hypothetical protein